MLANIKTFTSDLSRKFPFSPSKYIHIATKWVPSHRSVGCVLGELGKKSGKGSKQEKQSLTARAHVLCYCSQCPLQIIIIKNSLLSGYLSLDILTLELAPTNFFKERIVGRKINRQLFFKLAFRVHWTELASAQLPYALNLSFLLFWIQ